ncbi:MAG: methylenetetrahydrofolate reductase [NAD(P)H] [Desulfobacteraceae bacterium]
MQAGKLYSEKRKKPVVSFEFFPPRDEAAEAKFYNVVDSLSALEYDYMSVTFGAGGSTKDGSYNTVKKMIQEKNLPTVAYIAGFGLSPSEITSILDRYREIGVKTIFAIRGDEPKNADFTPHPDSFKYASDLIAFINKNYDFDLGCAGYPEGHIQAESLDKDISYLKLKQDNGAQYVIAQYFYENRFFFDYVEKCRAAGVTIPIIPGIMPIYSMKLTNMLCRLCGSTLPPEVSRKLEELTEKEKGAVAEYGIDFAVEQCRELLEKGVDGLHFYTMDRSRSVTEIITRLKKDNLL